MGDILDNIKAATEGHPYSIDDSEQIVIENCRDSISRRPVQPIRPRGHWIESEGGIACSECGNEENNESYYCPWCGADMRERRQKRRDKECGFVNIAKSQY